MMEQGFAVGTSSRAQGRIIRRVPVLCCAALLLSLAVLLVVPSFRSSAALLCNRLFDASEQVNRYVYVRLPVPEGTSAQPAFILLALAGAAAACWAMTARSQLPAVLMAVLTAGAQAWFGVSLPIWGNIGLYAFLAACVIGRTNGRRALLCSAACAAAVVLTVAAAFPGTHAAVEEASERVRDWFAAAPDALSVTDADEAADLMETRPENLRDLNEGDEAAREAAQYRIVTVEEQQVALPQWIDYLRIILMLLLIPVLLAVPFVPLWWMNRCTRKASARRECLDSDDPRTAVMGCFDLINDYLDACGCGGDNALRTERMAACSALPEEDQALYDQCARIWEEAAYSDHPVAQDAPALLARLLERVEEELYDKADRRTRLRLRFVCCLHE